MALERLEQIREVAERTRQSVYLVDDNDVYLSALYVLEEFRQRRTVHCPAGVAAVVIPLPDKRPSHARLTADVG